MSLIGDNLEEGELLKEKMGKLFEKKDLGTLMSFLGMEITRHKIGISVLQRKYVFHLLKEMGM